MEPTFPDVDVNTVMPNETIEVKIATNRICMRGKSASYVHHMEFDLAGTPLEGQFIPGQAIGVLPPGTDAQGRPEAVRLYSISSPTEEETFYAYQIPSSPYLTVPLVSSLPYPDSKPTFSAMGTNGYMISYEKELHYLLAVYLQ